MQGVMDHIVLNAEDIEAALHFYTEVVELEPERVEAFHRGAVPFPSVRVNAHTVIDLAPAVMWEQTQVRTPGRRNLNHFCVSLEKIEWEKLRERLTARNIAIEGPVPRWGARGHGTSFYFHDPEGNEIEARYYEG